MLSRFRQAGLIWPTFLAALALVVLLGLGTWQLQRKTWKEGLVRAIDARAAAAPSSPEQIAQLRCNPVDDGIEQSCEYRRVRLRGSFDHAGERHIFAGVQGPQGRGTLGYWVFTPFRVAGAAKPIWVNRGFVPEALKSPGSRMQGQIQGETEIVAQVRTRQERGSFDGANSAEKNIYYVRDPKELGTAYGDVKRDIPLLEAGWAYLEIVSGAPPGGYPQPLAGHVEISNRHLEYMLTWYGLALTLIGVYAAFVRARLGLSRQVQPT